MKAVVLDEERRLELREVPEPVPAAGQALVDVRAAGVNYADVLIRDGRYPQAPTLPYVPGNEIAGETEEGKRVMGFCPPQAGGGYAQKAVAEEAWLFELPEEATFEQGAAFLLAFLTAWIPLTRQVSLRDGSRVLVTAAAGGVGSAGVQVARALGAEVVGAVGSPSKRDHVLDLGASEAVTYDEVDGLEPFDAILDQVGGELFAAAIKLLRPLGTIVAIGFAGGAWPPLDPALLVGRNVSASGFYLGRYMKLQPEAVQEAARELIELWADRRISPVVGATYPLGEADAALQLVADRRSTGKVVLLP